MIKESNRFLYQNNLQEKFFIFINKFLLCFENSSMGCTVEPSTFFVEGFLFSKDSKILFKKQRFCFENSSMRCLI